MKTFIKAIEIWIPDRERTQLELGSGLYGTLTDFKTASEWQHFAYGEGLPGKAWAEGHPIVLTKFEHSCFRRTEVAHQSGLTCGIALPIFSGDFLMAVVVFLCGDDDEQIGAIEVWRNDPAAGDLLRVMDGYYGKLEQFEKVSRQLQMPKGQGLAGMAWETGMPVLRENFNRIAEFDQEADAQQTGITTGLGIPAAHSHDQIYVMTFLSAKATPIAKRVQIWIPDDENDRLVCLQGYSKESNNLAEIFETLTVKKGVGALGRVWLTGMPLITGNLDIQYNPELDSLSSMLAIPVIERGKLKAIATFLF